MDLLWIYYEIREQLLRDWDVLWLCGLYSTFFDNVNVMYNIQKTNNVNSRRLWRWYIIYVFYGLNREQYYDDKRVPHTTLMCFPLHEMNLGSWDNVVFLLFWDKMVN